MSAKLSEGVGIVQLGEVKSYGKWRFEDGQLQISFETQSLSLDKQQSLQRYRNSPNSALPVLLPGGRRKTNGRIIGFEREHKTATFYVSREEPAER